MVFTYNYKLSKGYVATSNWRKAPDANKYCCVKNEYVTSGGLDFVWNDKGSRAKYDVSIWKVIGSGIQGGNFIANDSRRKPSNGLAFMLKNDDTRVQEQD